MKSPTHKANILNGKFTEIGVATAEGTHKGHKTTYVVQMFGTPSNRGTTATKSHSISSKKHNNHQQRRP
jgi:hypothetical protein